MNFENTTDPYYEQSLKVVPPSERELTPARLREIQRKLARKMTGLDNLILKEEI